MRIEQIINSIHSLISGTTSTSTSTSPKDSYSQIVSQTVDCPQMLENVSECLASAGKMQVRNSERVLSPDAKYLRCMTDKYSQSDAQIRQNKQNTIEYLKKISSNLEDILESATSDQIETILAKKAVVDYLIEHISYNDNVRLGNIGFEFGLPTKKINSELSGFQEEFDKSVSVFKEENILSVYDYNPKEHQFDAEEIIKKYEKQAHEINEREYRQLFDPIKRLDCGILCNDPYLNSSADFYRIISPNELKNLLKTKETKTFIDSNDYYTDGHYSCITTNPNYNEQMFDELSIRLKFKTRDDDGLYNMDLFNRIGVIKPQRSIYKVYGYNFYDIDWDNVCINLGNGWKRLDKDFIEAIINKDS